MIRLLNQKDVCQLACVHQRCFDDAWSSTVFLDYFVRPEWNGVFGYGYFSTLDLPYSGGFSINGEQLIGFIMGRTVFESNDLFTFAVLPDYQQKGIGRALLDHYLKGLEVNCLLEVSIQNEKAIHLYSSVGFNVITLKKGYYSTVHSLQSDAYVMKRSI
jgi:ribosomal protein S18 acetylase RimI-like enzyme